MNNTLNGYEYLKMLQEESSDGKITFDKFSDYLGSKAKKQGVPISGMFELTPLCNFSCKMCYVHLTKDQLQSRKMLRPDEWKDLIYQAWECGMLMATLSGGECLTYPGFKEIYSYLHNLGCEVYLMTNGALLTDEQVGFLKKHRPAGVQITLYGYDDDSYERVTGQRAFGLVRDNIQRMIDADMRVTIIITPNNYLGEDVFDTIREAKKLCSDVRVNSTLFSPRKETGRSDQNDNPDLDLYRRAYQLEWELRGRIIEERSDLVLPEPGGPCSDKQEKGLTCGGGRSSFLINWKGEMYPCTRIEKIKAFPFIDGFQAAWKAVNQQAMNWIREPACIGCPYESICAPCPAVVDTYSQPGGRPEEWCKRTVCLVRHGIWRVPDCN